MQLAKANERAATSGLLQLKSWFVALSCFGDSLMALTSPAKQISLTISRQATATGSLEI